MKKVKYKEECQQLRPMTFYYSQFANKKVPFYNSEDYTVSVGDGKCVYVPPYVENAMIRDVMFGSDSRKSLYKDIITLFPSLNMIERDEFVNNFMNSHKMYPIKNFPEDIKVYAINGKYSFTSGYNEAAFTITAEQELELNAIIKEYGSDKCFKPVRQWFSKYHKDRCCSVLPEVAETYSEQYLLSKGIDYKTGFTWNDANTWINCFPIFCKTVVFWIFIYILYKCLTD